MAGRILRSLLWGAVGVVAFYFLALYFVASPTAQQNASPARGGRPVANQAVAPRPGSATWGNRSTLADHFARHGSDFGARNADEYADMATQFWQRAHRDGLPAKLGADGTVRIYDPGSGSFGAYNSDGSTKTFFKPGNQSYFTRQPGRSIDLRTGR